jgi:RimJ/RimL family protein N-acetyltransferase
LVILKFKQVSKISTERLLLRPFQLSDSESLFAMNSNPQVMEFFPKLLSHEESDAMLGRMIAHYETHGYGCMAVEVPGQTNFAGFLGIWNMRFESWFTPGVEIGWRLLPEFQGKGFATEGAKAALQDGFQRFNFEKVFAFMAVQNSKSENVMKKIGMKHIGEFDHPLVEEGPLRKHLVYEILS